jgi:hypothetical protein
MQGDHGCRLGPDLPAVLIHGLLQVFARRHETGADCAGGYASSVSLRYLRAVDLVSPVSRGNAASRMRENAGWPTK